MWSWKTLVGVLCCLFLATIGCRTCQNPYCDCGPVWSQGVCQNCNPDYRAGSVLNRHGPGALPAEGAAQTPKPAAVSSQPAPRTAKPAAAIAKQSESEGRSGGQTRVRAMAVAQHRTADRTDDDPESARTRTDSSASEVSAPSKLPPGTVPAPPGTKEGDKRILSVTDRRLDELQRTPKSLPAEHQSPQPKAQKADKIGGGWQPAAPHQEPAEPATQLRASDL
jgi:hypothetical protein